MTGSGLAGCMLAALLLLTTGAVPIPRDSDGPNIPIEHVIFQLYTQTSPNEGSRVIVGDEQSLIAANFDPAIPTKILIHGWRDTIQDGCIQRPKRAFLEREPMNVFGVGWDSCARNLLYEEAVECAKQVGAYAGQLVAWLNKTTGAPLQSFHAIGHSLGGQAIAFMSSEGVPITRMSALDPANPLFAHAGPDNSLDVTDADFVDVTHTSAGFLGMVNNIGHVDFYPNGGSQQPGCSDFFGGCSHSAAYHYYAHTVSEKFRDDYMAYKCDSLELARNLSCTGAPQAPMGYYATIENRGIYYVNITEVPYE